MRFFSKALYLYLLLILSTSLPVQAETLLTPDIYRLSREAHNILANAKLSDGSLIGEERAKTLVYPLIPDELIDLVVKRGYLSGFAAGCGLDWEKGFFLPTMSFVHQKHKDYNDFQFAYVGMLHGLSMGEAEKSLEKTPCDDALKKKLISDSAVGK